MSDQLPDQAAGNALAAKLFQYFYFIDKQDGVFVGMQVVKSRGETDDFLPMKSQKQVMPGIREKLPSSLWLDWMVKQSVAHPLEGGEIP
jgi:hypothetical protein